MTIIRNLEVFYVNFLWWTQDGSTMQTAQWSFSGCFPCWCFGKCEKHYEVPDIISHPSTKKKNTHPWNVNETDPLDVSRRSVPYSNIFQPKIYMASRIVEDVLDIVTLNHAQNNCNCSSFLELFEVFWCWFFDFLIFQPFRIKTHQFNFSTFWIWTLQRVTVSTCPELTSLHVATSCCMPSETHAAGLSKPFPKSGWMFSPKLLVHDGSWWFMPPL